MLPEKKLSTITLTLGDTPSVQTVADGLSSSPHFPPASVYFRELSTSKSHIENRRQSKLRNPEMFSIKELLQEVKQRKPDYTQPLSPTRQFQRLMQPLQAHSALNNDT